MLNASKCKLLCSEVEYLGHVVTKDGLKPNNYNLDAVKFLLPVIELYFTRINTFIHTSLAIIRVNYRHTCTQYITLCVYRQLDT